MGEPISFLAFTQSMNLEKLNNLSLFLRIFSLHFEDSAKNIIKTNIPLFLEFIFSAVKLFKKGTFLLTNLKEQFFSKLGSRQKQPPEVF